MSHGGGGEGGVKAEPNLTPMLDLVLQLVMFFMLVANFAMEQVSADVSLPSAQSAVPPDKTDEPLFLNVLPEGNVKVTGKEELLDTEDRIKFYLLQEASDIKKKNKERGLSEDLNTIIVIRADRSADYKSVYKLLQLCKTVGFRKLQLRATIKAG